MHDGPYIVILVAAEANIAFERNFYCIIFIFALKYCCRVTYICGIELFILNTAGVSGLMFCFRQLVPSRDTNPVIPEPQPSCSHTTFPPQPRRTSSHHELQQPDPPIESIFGVGNCFSGCTITINQSSSSQSVSPVVSVAKKPRIIYSSDESD